MNQGRLYWSLARSAIAANDFGKRQTLGPMAYDVAREYARERGLEFLDLEGDAKRIARQQRRQAARLNSMPRRWSF
jgi:hypothetical protein